MADTIANPRTVVVHPENATVADAAMVGTVRFVKVAGRAVTIISILLFPFQNYNRLKPRNNSGVREVCFSILNNLFHAVVIFVFDLEISINPFLSIRGCFPRNITRTRCWSQNEASNQHSKHYMEWNQYAIELGFRWCIKILATTIPINCFHLRDEVEC